MTQSYRNLIASGIVLQLAMLDLYFTLKAGAGGAVWLKFILYALSSPSFIFRRGADVDLLRR
jgi:hypothetical protein